MIYFLIFQGTSAGRPPGTGMQRMGTAAVRNLYNYYVTFFILF